jgi:hypothetical protein
MDKMAFKSGASVSRNEAANGKKRVVLSVVLTAVAVHLIIGVLAGVWIVARYFIPPPAVFEVKRDLKMTVTEREHRMNMAEFDALTPKPSFNEKLASLRPTEFALPDLPQVPLDQMLPLDPSAIVSDQVSSMLGTAGFGAGGFGAGGMGGEASGMSFFGIKDSGRSVVIMIDVSNSMFTRTGDAKGSRLKKKGKNQSFQVVRNEANKLIEGLSINSRFGIIKWSGGAYSWKSDLIPATDQYKAAAIQWVQTRVDFNKAGPRDDRPGGTRHDYALEEAFKLRPEVIYMLTDGNATEARPGGGLSPIDSNEIYEAAEKGQKTLEKGARLHVIYYVTGTDKEEERRMLMTLASRNHGKFREVEAEGRKKR